MSGSGKSYWSKKLQAKGFKRFCCDDLIEKKLENELKKLGYSGIQDVAKWMGQPFDTQYLRSSKEYLTFEKEVLHEILIKIASLSTKDVVIDTTGSVIYAEKALLEKLAKTTKIIYINTPASVQEEMYQLYLKDPKPVVWGTMFEKMDQESNLEALARCYPLLLAYRTKKYKNLANITLDYHTLHDPQFSVDKLLLSIR